MSEPENIKQFNEYAERIFAKLYESFPNERAIMVSDAVGANIPYDQIPNYREWPPEWHTARATIWWLLDEGYFKGRKSQVGAFPVVLSSLAWNTLNLPSSLNPRRTWGELLVSGAKGAGSEAGKATVGLVMSALAAALGLGG